MFIPLKTNTLENKPFLFFFIIIILNACNNNEATYHSVLDKQIKKGGFNGNVLVFDDGQVVVQKAHGLANIHSSDSLEVNSIFRLGSVSKQFTAMAIAMLEEDGAVSYDQNIRDFIPELPYENVTIEHLIHHTSGLPDYVELMMDHWKPELKEDDPSRFISGNDEIIQMMVQKHPKIHFDPGQKWEYSNTGYVLLATIVERVSGKSFGDFLKQRVFEPTGMNNTSVYTFVKGPDPKMPLRVFGFKETDDVLVPNDTHFLNFAKGDGGIYATLGDLLKWDRMLYTDQLVSRATLEKIYESGTLDDGEPFNYGFGWFLENGEREDKSVYHGGGWVGFGTYIYRDLSTKSCFIVLTNNSSWEEVETLVTAFKDIMADKG